MKWLAGVVLATLFGLGRLLLAEMAPTWAEGPQALLLHFEQETQTNGPKEMMRGTLYYSATGPTAIQVTEPVSQMMMLEGHTLLIHYPELSRAFRFHARARFPLPLLDAVLAATKPDADLSAHGYRLSQHEQRDGVIYTHWESPKELSSALGPTVLGLVEDRIVSLESRAPDGTLRARFLYAKHLRLGDWQLPMEVRAVVHDPVAGYRQELIRYTDAQLNQPPPQWVRQFEIPDGVDVKEVKW